MNLKNRKVLITGASSGLGAEIAKILINKYDCQVLGVARNEQKLQQLKQELGEKSANFSYHIMDVSLEQNWKELYQKLVTENQVIEILINNAGVMLPFKATDRTDISEFERIMQVNYFSIVYSCKTFMPMLMRQQNNPKKDRPVIVNIASLAALCCLPGVGGYSASKAAIKSYTEALSVELGKSVFVSLIMPGFVRTNILGGGIVEPEDEKLINKFAQPVGRTSKKIVRRVRLNRRRMILGPDALAMALFYRWFPRSSGRVVGKILKLSKRKTVGSMYTNKEDYIEKE